jgi:hypothetical protein
LLEFFYFYPIVFSLFFELKLLLFAISCFFPLVLLSEFSDFGGIFTVLGWILGWILTVLGVFLPCFWPISSCFWPVFDLFSPCFCPILELFLYYFLTAFHLLLFYSVSGFILFLYFYFASHVFITINIFCRFCFCIFIFIFLLCYYFHLLLFYNFISAILVLLTYGDSCLFCIVCCGWIFIYYSSVVSVSGFYFYLCRVCSCDFLVVCFLLASHVFIRVCFVLHFSLFWCKIVSFFMTNNSLVSCKIGCFSQNPLKCQNVENSKNALKWS